MTENQIQLMNVAKSLVRELDNDIHKESIDLAIKRIRAIERLLQTITLMEEIDDDVI